MDLKVSMVILSHLSDMECDMGSVGLLQRRLDFIRVLVVRYPDTSVTVPEEEIDAIWNGLQ